MLKRVLSAAVAMALLVTVAVAAVWLWGQASSPVEAKVEGKYSSAETITVVGQGSVQTSPDIARVSIGVETSGETISVAVEENAAKMEALLAALEEAGIEEKDIQTMNYSIQLDRYPEPMPRIEPAGAEVEAIAAEPRPVYRVSNMVNVIIRDLESVGDVLDAAIEAGANNVWGLSFTLDDPAAAQVDARAAAIEDALARAEALAELSGVELGPVMSVSEVVSGTPAPMPVMVERAVSSAGPISPGELEIGYQVQVVYFIER